MMIGITPITAPEINKVLLFPYGLNELYRPMGNVNFILSVRTSNSQRPLFYEDMPIEIPITAMAGFMIGRISLIKIPYSLHPSILPASAISFGVF